jgi:general secretion pathway protein A
VHLLAQRQAGKRSVVIVDEAQGLSLGVLEELRLLSNLETTTEKLLRIVIVGQPQLRALLLHPSLVQLNQRITLRWHVGPLAPAETAAYVRHRLAVASRGQAGRVFTRPALWLVHRLSGGVPRLINMIAHRAMLAAERRRVGLRSVLRAYRELESVPLPALTPTPRRAAWSTLAVGVVLGVVALGLGQTALAPGTAPGPETSAATASVDVASLPPMGPAAEPMASPAEPVASPAEPVAPPAEPVAPPAEPVAPPVAAPPATVQEEQPAALPEPAPPPVAEPAPPVAPPPGEALAQRLAASDAETSARAAVDAVLAAWHAPPLAPREAALTSADLDTLARARGLEYLSLGGSASLLRLLDLPAVLELRLPGGDGPRYAALTGTRDGAWLLSAGDDPVAVDSTFLDRDWFGQARLFWRDHEVLGTGIIDPQTKGPPVARLQALLRRIGLYQGADTGLYGPSTEAAVLEFQRRHLLLADARVGPLTRIMLYAVAGGYAAPRLTGGAS